MKVYAKVKQYVSYLKGKQNPETKYRLFLQSRGTASAEDVISEAAGHCDIKPLKLREAMEALGEAITHFIQMGFDVRVPGLGNIQLQLRAKEVDKPEDATRDTFKNESQPISVTILPTEGLKDAVKGISLHVLKWGETSEGADDSDNTDNTGGGNSDSGNQNQGGNGGGLQQEPTKYRITFKFSDNTEDDHEYEAGETINYPTNTSGYTWPDNKPRVMPAENVTVKEEVDDDEIPEGEDNF